MKRIRIGYGWVALAALAVLGTNLGSALAQYAPPKRSVVQPARFAPSGSTMRIAQTPAPPPTGASTPTPAAPQQSADVVDDSSDPFVDDAEQTYGPRVPTCGEDLWQAPPSLPSAQNGCGHCLDDCDLMNCCTPKCSCWYGGADYLLAKAHFSQGYAAIVCTTTTSTATTPNVSTLTENAVPFPYKYSSMYRVFLGYHLNNCGGDINFTYWNLQSTAATTLGPADVTNGTNVIFGQVLNNPADGQFLNASSGIRINLFDIDFSKFLILGGPSGPCDCNSCPRWDMRWFAGARIAQVYRFDNNQVLNGDGSVAALGMINANFYGAGPKIGIQMRRYIGASQRLSVYAKGSGSLLLGQFHGTRTQNIPGDTLTPTTITTANDNMSRVIPVTDIEVGGSYQVMPQCFVSAGYFVQCWWDTGFGETIGTGAVTSFGALDTSNIMAWTGLFVRTELFF